MSGIDLIAAVANEHVGSEVGVAGTRLVASDEKATKRPSAEIDGSALSPLAWRPLVVMLTRVGRGQ